MMSRKQPEPDQPAFPADIAARETDEQVLLRLEWTVLRRLDGHGMLEEHPNLVAYVARGEGRPAYQRAFAAQLAVFAAGAT